MFSCKVILYNCFVLGLSRSRARTGREPVREWLRELGPADRKSIGGDIRDVELSLPVGMPLVR